MQFIPAETKQT